MRHGLGVHQSELIYHSEGRVTLAATSPRKGGVASVPVSPSEVGVAFVLISARERGVASLRSVKV